MPKGYYNKLVPRNVEPKILVADAPRNPPLSASPFLPKTAQFKLHHPLLPSPIKLGIHRSYAFRPWPDETQVKDFLPKQQFQDRLSVRNRTSRHPRIHLVTLPQKQMQHQDPPGVTKTRTQEKVGGLQCLPSRRQRIRRNHLIELTSG